MSKRKTPRRQRLLKTIMTVIIVIPVIAYVVYQALIVVGVGHTVSQFISR